LNAVKASTGKITERLRKAMCEFQLEYTNYFFSSSRLHKAFKESEETKKSQTYLEMNTLLEVGLKKIFGDLAAKMQHYFVETHSSQIPPRVGVHLVTEDNEVIDVIQMPSTNSSKVIPKKIQDYSVLEEVIATGKPYIQNNIPKHIINSAEYKHKGLNVAKIREEYILPIADCKFLSRWRSNILKKPSKNENWCKMRTGKNVGHNSLYKSHVVIPITYRRHADKASMNDEMVRVLQLDDDGRSILGFLFVDHPETYYFHDADPHNYNNIDINSLMMFADMISMVIVTKLMYTVGSTTTNDFKKNKSRK
jgi:hypothetical protein